MGYRTCLAKGAYFSGAAMAARKIRSWFWRELPVLAYHRVLDMGTEDEYPFDPELVSANTAEFSWQMAYVARHFDVVTFGELLGAMAGNGPVPRRPLVVTFDDGFDDNYRVVYPILRQYGIPATFFVSTGYVGGDQTFWFDWIANMIYRAPTGTLRLDVLALEFLLGNIESRRKAAKTLLRTLKRVEDAVRVKALQELEMCVAHFPSDAEKRQSRVLNWAQIREMSNGGMEFGSHSVSHPVLSRVDDAKLAFEMRESKVRLETELGSGIDVFSYPVGGASEISTRVMEMAEATGYRLAASYIHGINAMGSLDRFRIRRLHVERHLSRAYFVSMLNFPGLF